MDNQSENMENKPSSSRHYWSVGLVALVVVAALIIIKTGQPVEAPIALEGDDSVSEESATTVKEFSLDSFVELEGEQPRPQFSLKKIEVNQGDTVRIKINTLSGRHNFNLDEFGVAVDTPTGEETVVEFVADQAGEFVYYCGMLGHREAGHWGTLKVLTPEAV